MSRAVFRHRTGGLRAEDGIAMPVALAVLLMCVILTAAVSAGADRLTGTSGEDQRSKRAFAAADAGIGVAVARLRALGAAVQDGQCLTNVGVAPGTGGAAAGECPSWGQQLGTGARFDFTVTPATETTGACQELPDAVVPAGALRRCITSTGTVNGSTRRVQAQVVAPRAARHWIGILGLDGVLLNNSPRLGACLQPGSAVVGSNVLVDADDNSGVELNYGCAARQWTLSVPAGGNVTYHKDTKPHPPLTSTATAPFVIDPAPVDWETVEQPQNNQNAFLLDPAVTTYTGNASFDATTRVGSLGNDGKVVVRRGGDFHICGLSLGNQGSIDFSTTERTRIFIDSPTRPGSPCAPGTGYFTTDNSARFNWPSTVPDTDEVALSSRAKNVELYLYGNGQPVNYGNQVRFAALIHAPTSHLVFGNSASIFGAAAGRYVTVTNGSIFRRPADLDKLGGASGAWAPTGWGQCRSQRPVATDPESGC